MPRPPININPLCCLMDSADFLFCTHNDLLLLFGYIYTTPYIPLPQFSTTLRNFKLLCDFDSIHFLYTHALLKVRSIV